MFKSKAAILYALLTQIALKDKKYISFYDLETKIKLMF